MENVADDTVQRLAVREAPVAAAISHNIRSAHLGIKKSQAARVYPAQIGWGGEREREGVGIRVPHGGPEIYRGDKGPLILSHQAFKRESLNEKSTENPMQPQTGKKAHCQDPF